MTGETGTVSCRVERTITSKEMSLTKNQIKYIRSLELKKNRRAEGVFLAEGPKVVGDLLGRFPCRLLVGTREWLRHLPPCLADNGTQTGATESPYRITSLEVAQVHRHGQKNDQVPHYAQMDYPPHYEMDGHTPRYGIDEVVEVSEDELRRASLLKTPQQVLALFEQPTEPADWAAPHRELCLALDGVQDPGNLGTIVRLADWFGIRHVYCSPGTVDAYSPKVIQATMGSIARVSVSYVPLPDLIAGHTQSAEWRGDMPVYGTFLDGGDLYQTELSDHGLLVMGNEGNGISAEVARLVSHRICIPAYPAGRADAPDSLNVAIATAIVCAEWRRRAALR